jgi:hypothetical protein
MRTLSISQALRLAGVVLLAARCVPAPTRAEASPAPTPASPRAETPTTASQPRDGQHDFDFLFGAWKVSVRRLKNPLQGSHEWYDMTGRSVIRPIWGGKANFEEVESDGPNGHMEAIMVRLYSPTSRQWSLNWVNQKNPRFDVPTVGEFKDGRGEFYDQELFEGRSILVRYVWSDIKPSSAHFEQAFSPDGGKTWEVNWISQITRAD